MDDKEAKERFLLLVEEYRLAAWIGLGKIKDPGDEGLQRNLKLARHAIDTLGMLEHKTRGNLVEDEERYLRQALTDLRMNYMDELTSEERGAEADAGDAKASSPGPEPATGGGEEGTQDPAADPASASSGDANPPDST